MMSHLWDTAVSNADATAPLYMSAAACISVVAAKYPAIRDRLLKPERRIRRQYNRSMSGRSPLKRGPAKSKMTGAVSFPFNCFLQPFMYSACAHDERFPFYVNVYVGTQQFGVLPPFDL